MFILTLLSVACCCGIPGYYAKPLWDQYPARAELRSEVANLRLLDDPASTETTEQLKADLGAEYLLVDETFAAVYEGPGRKRVTVFGVTGFRLTPDSDVADELTRLADRYNLKERPTPTGDRGEYVGCAEGQADGTDVVVCTWADHGSLGTALFTRLSIPDSAALLTQLRESIIIRDPMGV